MKHEHVQGDWDYLWMLPWGLLRALNAMNSFSELLPDPEELEKMKSRFKRQQKEHARSEKKKERDALNAGNNTNNKKKRK